MTRKHMRCRCQKKSCITIQNNFAQGSCPTFYEFNGPIDMETIESIRRHHAEQTCRLNGKDAGTESGNNTDISVEEQQERILEYVLLLKENLSRRWRDHWERIWRELFAQEDIRNEIYAPGRQKGTSFNRKMVARIIHEFGMSGAFGDNYCAQHLCLKLEGVKDHPVRMELGQKLQNKNVCNLIGNIIRKAELSV